MRSSVARCRNVVVVVAKAVTIALIGAFAFIVIVSGSCIGAGEIIRAA
jgi:hypothetical protein